MDVPETYYPLLVNGRNFIKCRCRVKSVAPKHIYPSYREMMQALFGPNWGAYCFLLLHRDFKVSA